VSSGQLMMALILLGSSPAWGAVASLASDTEDVRTHAEQSFEQLSRGEHRTGLTTFVAGSHSDSRNHAGYSPDLYVIGIGHGDLAKGPIVCQRVSELSARTDLAKQIRVLVKEHMIDRIRERSGKEVDQDIELTREEIVQEYLQGVKIVDRHIDEEKMICSATAVMPKNQLQPLPLSNEPSRSSPLSP
jgi:hypothetical protein